MFTMLYSTSLAHYLQTLYLSLNIIENLGLVGLVLSLLN